MPTLPGRLSRKPNLFSTITAPSASGKRRRTAMDVLKDLEQYDATLREQNWLTDVERTRAFRPTAAGTGLGMLFSGIVGGRGGADTGLLTAMPGLQAIHAVVQRNEQARQLADQERQRRLALAAKALMEDVAAETAAGEKEADRLTEQYKAQLSAAARVRPDGRKKVGEYIDQTTHKLKVLFDDGTVEEAPTAAYQRPEKAEISPGDQTRIKMEALRQLDQVRTRHQALQRAYTATQKDQTEELELIRKALPEVAALKDKAKVDQLKELQTLMEEQYKSLNQWQELAGFDVTPSFFTGRTYRSGNPDVLFKKPRGKGK